MFFVAGGGGAVVRHVQIDPEKNPASIGVRYVNPGLAILIRVSGANDLGELAGRTSPAPGLNVEDVVAGAIDGPDPLRVRAHAADMVVFASGRAAMVPPIHFTLGAFAGEYVVGDVEEVCLVAGKVDITGLFPFVVALDAVAIEHGLHDFRVAESLALHLPYAKLSLPQQQNLYVLVCLLYLF